VEDGAASVLLTGDARGDQIVDGLKQAGRLVKKLARTGKGRFSFEFLTKGSTITIL
jgi:hypothetical protein